jgi:hypothetical protein
MSENENENENEQEYEEIDVRTLVVRVARAAEEYVKHHRDEIERDGDAVGVALLTTLDASMDTHCAHGAAWHVELPEDEKENA